MELIDVLTPTGELTGLVKSRKQIHLDGDWHRAVHIWLLNSKGELLLQRRSASKINNPNMWDISAAGHVSAGDSALVSAYREVEEELGIRLPLDAFQHLGTISATSILNNGTYINNEINDLYIVKKNIPLEELTLQKEEIEELKYIHWKTLQQWFLEKRKDLVYHKAEYELLFAHLSIFAP